MIIAMIIALGVIAIWNGYIANSSDLDRARAEATLLRREVELREGQRLAQLGSWWWDLRRDSVTWSEGLSHIALRDPLLPPPTYQEQLGFFTPQSSPLLAAAVERWLDLDGQATRARAGDDPWRRRHRARHCAW